MDIILAWIAASGKWTQSHKLLEHFGNKLKYFETWNILRTLQSSDNAIWNYLKDITANGLLVKDEIIVWLFRIFLETLWDWEIILADWCMRRIWQTKSIIEQIKEKGRNFVVIEITLPEEEVYKRLSNRIMCKHCDWNFSIILDGDIESCLKCNWELYRRNDDQDERAIKNRIDSYKKEVLPALNMIDEMWYLLRIDGMQPVDHVFQQILKIIEQ